MNLKHQNIFSLITIVALFFNVTGGLAKDKFFGLSSEDYLSSEEAISPLTSGNGYFWAFQNFSQHNQLPEYSENQFYSAILNHRKVLTFSAGEKLLRTSAGTFLRDIKAQITIQLFPFHFFL